MPLILLPSATTDELVIRPKTTKNNNKEMEKREMKYAAAEIIISQIEWESLKDINLSCCG